MNEEGMAQDLHDDVGASISTLMLHISNLPLSPIGIKKMCVQYNERSLSIGKKALTDLRSISHDLMPKDFKNNGLTRMLHNRIEELKSSSSIYFSVTIEGDDTLFARNAVHYSLQDC
jgi:signal transduction histidine kinase